MRFRIIEIAKTANNQSSGLPDSYSARLEIVGTDRMDRFWTVSLSPLAEYASAVVQEPEIICGTFGCFKNADAVNPMCIRSLDQWRSGDEIEQCLPNGDETHWPYRFI